jgi:hypothetical protein
LQRQIRRQQAVEVHSQSGSKTNRRSRRPIWAVVVAAVKSEQVDVLGTFAQEHSGILWSLFGGGKGTHSSWRSDPTATARSREDIQWVQAMKSWTVFPFPLTYR